MQNERHVIIMPKYIIKHRNGAFRLYCNGVEVLARPKIDQVSQARDKLVAVFEASDPAEMDRTLDDLLDTDIEDEAIDWMIESMFEDEEE